MPAFVQATLFWVRRTLAWSNSRQSWQERFSLLFVLSAAVALFWFRDALTLPQETVLWGLLAIMTAILLRRGWFRLYGPLLFYELVRLARRRRHFVGRSLVPVPLAILVWWFYFLSVSEVGRLARNDMADLSLAFFYTFTVIQFFLIVFLTPAYTAGAIAEEKDRKTLEFLLATDLRNREIVFSKLAARYANLTLLVLTGLPILSIMQFMGGVDPNLLLVSFAALALTMASLAGFAILNSTLSKRSRDAIATTYLGAIGYIAISSASWLLLEPRGWASFPSTATWTSPITLEDAVHGLNFGNPFSAVVLLFGEISKGKLMGDVLPGIFGRYALFHGLLAICCPIIAALRLRASAEKHSYAKAAKQRWRLRIRPAVGSYPMLWKEIFAEPGLRFNLLGRIVVFLVVLGSFVPLAIIIAQMIDGTIASQSWVRNAWGEFARQVNEWIRFFGTVVACLMLLAVAVRASGSVSGERDRQTLDALLASPLQNQAILLAKWLGSIFSVRWGWLWLGLMYGIGLVTHGLELTAVGLLLLAWFIFAGTVASFGMWFSVVCRTTLRATLWTIVATIGAGVGHWLVWLFLYPIMASLQGPGESLQYIVKFEVGMTPPATLGYAFAFNDTSASYNDFGEVLGYALLGLLCWVVITAFVLRATLLSFEMRTGRWRDPFSPLGQRRPQELGAPPAATIQATKAS